jgi:hypothetical protein
VTPKWMSMVLVVLGGSTVWGDGMDKGGDFPPGERTETPEQARWYKSCLVWSSLSLVGAHAADAWSSWQGLELNPLLRGGEGRFGARGVAFKFSFSAGYLLLQNLVVRRQPASRKAWCATGFAGAAAVGGTALRNRRGAP